MHTHITSALLGWIYGICHQLSLEYDFISIAHFRKFVKGFFKFFLYIPEAVRHGPDRSRSVLFLSDWLQPVRQIAHCFQNIASAILFKKPEASSTVNSSF